MVVVAFISIILLLINLAFRYSNNNNEPISQTYSGVPVNKLTVQQAVDKSEKEKWLMNQQIYFNKLNTVNELVQAKEISQIFYSHLLSCWEWKTKRFKILVRDKFECKDCHVVRKNNHVHHLFYLKNHLPWEIEETALVTVCQTCHQKRHNEEKIKIYEKIKGKRYEVGDEDFFCSRCLGVGYIPEFDHVENGICFKCKGEILNQTTFNEALYMVKLSLYNNDLQLKSDFNNYLASAEIPIIIIKSDQS